jgi:hypothetical protein
VKNVANIIFLVAVAIAAILVETGYFGGAPVTAMVASSQTQGEVLTIEDSPSGQKERVAVVKLNSGTIVRASVAAPCDVRAGQIAELKLYRPKTNHSEYYVASARDKE